MIIIWGSNETILVDICCFGEYALKVNPNIENWKGYGCSLTILLLLKRLRPHLMEASYCPRWYLVMVVVLPYSSFPIIMCKPKLFYIYPYQFP